MPPPPSSPSPSPWLPDDLVEEVLLRLPPENPAGLVRAGLVCTRWCRLVSDPGFRRRFREFHRNPPLLGMLCTREDDFYHESHLVPTVAFRSPHADHGDWRAVDARHGRVLLHRRGTVLVVWDPITDEVRELPFPLEPEMISPWAAAVVCSAAGACAHLDCHHGPFLVVFVCARDLETLSVYTYSSDAAAWSEPVCAQQDFMASSWMGSALVGNSLYFGNEMGGTALKYDLELCQVSWILHPYLPWRILQESLLTTTEDGGLGIVFKDDCKLYLWSRKDTPELDAKWDTRIIELKPVFPVNLHVIGCCVGIIFMRTEDEVYTFDLKTYEMKKVYEGATSKVIPYMSFYTPALNKGPCTGEGQVQVT